MELHIADHPLISHKLTLLRNEDTPSPVFRDLTTELVKLLAYEATKTLKTQPVEINTPVTSMVGQELVDNKPLLVPILRAGLGMLDGMLQMVPNAEVGFLGLVRDEETLQPVTYAERLPDDIEGRQCYVLDPMLATGGSLLAAIRYLIDRGAEEVTAICIIAAPEGVELVRKGIEGFPVHLFIGGLDEGLDEKAYIVPGLGDAGDRLYGNVRHSL